MPNPPFRARRIKIDVCTVRNSTVRVGVTALKVEFFGANAPSADLRWSVEGKAHLGRRPATVELAPRLFSPSGILRQRKKKLESGRCSRSRVFGFRSSRIPFLLVVFTSW